MCFISAHIGPHQRSPVAGDNEDLVQHVHHIQTSTRHTQSSLSLRDLCEAQKNPDKSRGDNECELLYALIPSLVSASAATAASTTCAS